MGFETAAALADRGAAVVLACRDPAAAAAAADRIRARTPVSPRPRRPPAAAAAWLRRTGRKDSEGGRRMMIGKRSRAGWAGPAPRRAPASAAAE
jgi:hypothetical protein